MDQGRLHLARRVTPESSAPGSFATVFSVVLQGVADWTDAYLAFDVSEIAELYRNTGDAHYRDVARLLLHNTKIMVARRDRLYDFTGPGWQQEHWSFTPPRGYGGHRYWLPWLATSQLNGIVGLEELDPHLYETLVD